MIKKTVTITNKAGIHCRPSSVIMTAIGEYPDCSFELTTENGSTTLQSILELLSLGVCYQDEVTLKVTGDKEEKACAKICSLLEEEFDFPPQ